MAHGNLHAKPSEVGRTADEAGVGALLLTHVMPDLEDVRAAAEELVRDRYRGSVRWAADLVSVGVG